MTKEIIALEVTDEKVIHDYKIMKKLVKDVLKFNHNKKKVKIRSLLGDGTMIKMSSRFMNEKRIKPVNKVKKNSVISSRRNNKTRNREVYSCV